MTQIRIPKSEWKYDLKPKFCFQPTRLPVGIQGCLLIATTINALVLVFPFYLPIDLGATPSARNVALTTGMAIGNSMHLCTCIGVCIEVS